MARIPLARGGDRRLDPAEAIERDGAGRPGEPEAAIRLRDARDAVLAGIVEGDARARFDREPPVLREIGVAHPILRAGARRSAEARRPPFAAAAPRRGSRLREAARRQRAGQLGAERPDPRLQGVVEHPADHDHAAGEPLAHPTEIGMVELRHRAVAALQRPHQMAHGIEADAVALGHAAQPRRVVGLPVTGEIVG
ncbi:hypothetical protein [Methylobacterium tardum]|uniref:hypothetical protein n=1 Tax=Methylobacterium tardum TaxID=374432 RepID=UPI002020F6D0|nr:hypothetical protein [Methylobacterium tardum]URD35694.1 hypothetical protein M6G65_25020 [Methylobacterium tardum]